MAHAQKVEGLGLNLVKGKDFAFQRLVVTTETAVDAVVDTGVASIDGSKEHKAAAINLVLAVLGGVENLLNVGFLLDAEELGHIGEVESFELAGLVEDVVELGLGGDVIVKHSVELVAVDKILMSHVI